MKMRPRFPSAVYRHGSEPDPRFTLANERTFLAWIRTALAMIATGLAIELLSLDLQDDLSFAASLLLISAGIALPVLAWLEWGRVELAMRTASALPASLTSLLISLVVSASGALLVLAIVFE